MVASSEYPNDGTSADLITFYNQMRQANFDSLNEYKQLRSKVYILQRCGDYYSCTCYVGQKIRTQCKHAIMCAVKQRLFVFPREVHDPVLTKRRRVGRPAGVQRGGALSQI